MAFKSLERHTNECGCAHAADGKGSDPAALDASELGKDSPRRQLTSQKEFIWQMERIL